jgi:DNA-binding MarR family transcriptional regulator
MARRRWLTRREQQAWIGWLAASHLLDGALDQQLRRDSAITHSTYGVLVALASAPERTLRMADMALMTNSSQSRLSHAVATMEEAGWVSRTRNRHNSREVLATLTDAGHALLTAAAPAHVATVRRLMFDRLTAEQVDALIEITGVMLAALSDEGIRVPPALARPGAVSPGSG